MQHQPAPDDLHERLAGDVVAGAAEAAADEDEVDAGERAADGVGDGGEVIGHRRIAQQPQPERPQRRGQRLRVGVDRAPAEQFAAGGDELYRRHGGWRMVDG